MNIKENTVDKATVLKTLSYFDVFSHPLNKEELYQFSQNSISRSTIDSTIQLLEQDGVVYEFDEFYTLKDDVSVVKNRAVKEGRATSLMDVAHANGELIATFPFVRCVCLSGSISKMIMSEDADIDYFVISQSNRVWISKLLLTVYKKTLLRDRSSFFCMNYFISEGKKELPDENLFTATELCTLIPVTGFDIYRDLVNANQWVVDYLPQFNLEDENVFDAQDPSQGLLSRIIERGLSGKLGDLMDTLAHRLYKNLNRRRYAKRFKTNYNQMFRSTKEQSKIHTEDSQNSILTKYNEIYASLNIEC